MHNSKDFRLTTRRGLRASRPTLIMHAVHTPDDLVSQNDAVSRPGPRIGFVVSGALGNAVTRNRVKRRLRHLAAVHVADTPVGIDPVGIDPGGIDPGGIDIVVRALPRAATVPAEVPEDFGSAWYEVVSRLSARQPKQDGAAR
jgi:ribonuclease P protein component